MPLVSNGSNFSSKQMTDSETFSCRRCLENDKTNTVKQYYVNLDTTISMCSLCQGLYLAENEVSVHNSVRQSVSSKSLKKMSLLPFLLGEEPNETLTQDEAKQILATAYQNYRRSYALEEAKLNDFLSLVSQLLPNHASCSQPSRNVQNVGTLATLNTPHEDSNSADKADTFYFSNGLSILRSEITDDDIDAAISALSRGHTPEIIYEDLPDIDSLLAYSVEVDRSLPILSDEALLSPIYLDKIDETLKHLNKNQESGIKINVDFDALQKMLAAPSISSTRKSSNEQTKTRSKKVERYLAKSNLRPCDLLRKAHQMQLWKEKSAGVTSLSKLSRGLDKVNAETKAGIGNSLKSEAETESRICLFNKSDSIARTSVANASPSRNSNRIISTADQKLFKGFEFAEFSGEVAKSSTKPKGKAKKKCSSKAITPTVSLIQKFRRQNLMS